MLCRPDSVLTIIKYLVTSAKRKTIQTENSPRDLWTPYPTARNPGQCATVLGRGIVQRRAPGHHERRKSRRCTIRSITRYLATIHYTAENEIARRRNGGEQERQGAYVLNLHYRGRAAMLLNWSATGYSSNIFKVRHAVAMYNGPEQSEICC